MPPARGLRGVSRRSGVAGSTMAMFVMLTRLAPGAMRSPRDLETLEKGVVAQVRRACPEMEWQASYAVLGRFDYVDVFNAPDVESATKVSALVRTFGHAHTEVWPATEWSRFKELIRGLPVRGG